MDHGRSFKQHCSSEVDQGAEPAAVSTAPSRSKCGASGSASRGWTPALSLRPQPRGTQTQARHGAQRPAPDPHEKKTTPQTPDRRCDLRAGAQAIIYDTGGHHRNELDVRAANLLVLEQDDSLSDRRQLYTMTRTKQLHGVRYEHRRASAEQLLAIRDALT